ncbi:uncharacterized protein LOC131624413 [Vicia villosa]|uniref:uncharacterized protein LOC131624409 n=1 Tax=Vicia villosa TaxID=3911 RepID=UPI00273B37CF|nr:uncharacterized protein LOC131624409 [Vicia villosa]XP_058751337.1 uncharacterized protein LOC131624413 [Vicia villosa]
MHSSSLAENDAIPRIFLAGNNRSAVVMTTTRLSSFPILLTLFFSELSYLSVRTLIQSVFDLNLSISLIYVANNQTSSETGDSSIVTKTNEVQKLLRDGARMKSFVGDEFCRLLIEVGDDDLMKMKNASEVCYRVENG